MIANLLSIRENTYEDELKTKANTFLASASVSAIGIFEFICPTLKFRRETQPRELNQIHL